MVENPACGFKPETATPAACAILGFGYLGRPLAERLYQHGCHVSALKRRLTSDDINLPIGLHTADLNQTPLSDGLFACWQGIPTWICLLPPSAFADYPALIAAWVAAAERYGAEHLIFTGSIGVYGRQERVCDEDSPPDDGDEKAVRLLAAEQAVRASSVAATDILRLGGLYDAERHPLATIAKNAGRLKGGEAVNMLHRDRAVSALFQTACTPDGHRLRNLVETPHPSRRSFYAAEAAKLGLPVPQFAEGGGRGRTVQTRYGDFSAILQLADTAG